MANLWEVFQEKRLLQIFESKAKAWAFVMNLSSPELIEVFTYDLSGNLIQATLAGQKI